MIFRLALLAVVCIAVVTAEEAEEEEEPPQVVRVGRMSFEGVWYLVDKGNGVVYANDVQNPEIVGSFSAEEGIVLDDSDDDEDEEEEEDAAQAAAEAAGTAAAPEETCKDDDGNPLVDSDGKSKCGCGALKRAAGSAYAGGPQVDMTHSDGDNEDRAAAALVELVGGTFTLGSDAGFFPEDGEGPAREVSVGAFRIGQHEVSNARFATFVEATGYVTEAERFGNSFAVEQFVSAAESAKISSAVAAAPWWVPVDKCDWRHPEGPDSNLTSRGDRTTHPAVHVSYNDAAAFCKWSTKGGRLPTEAEWEFAAAGGKKGRKFPWGNKFLYKGGFNANTWQTEIPDKHMQDKNVFQHSFMPTDDGHHFFSSKNTAEDGWELTAPVDEYQPNKYGLYNTVGNVWEWTSDWQIPNRNGLSSEDPQSLEASNTNNKVKKGGSYMCHQFTCYRYRIAARMFITPDSSASNVGFRCAA